MQKGDVSMKAKVLVDNITKNQWKAEWGLSIYIEYNGHRILLDTGTTEAFAENADQMGVRLEDVEFGVLSHAHYDHSDGLGEFFKRNPTAKFYLQKSAEENCYSRKNFLFKKYIGIRRGYLEAYKDRIVYADGDLEVIPGVTLLAHRTPGLADTGRKAGMYVKKNGRWKPDDFSHEQCLVVSQDGHRVLVSGCAHNGILNILDRYRDLFGGDPDVVISGFHMMKKQPYDCEELDVIDETARELARHNTVFYTGHCTGLPAFERMQTILGEQLRPLHSGVELDLATR